MTPILAGLLRLLELAWSAPRDHAHETTNDIVLLRLKP